MAEREKTHHDCKCRDCDPMTAMAERMDAWKAAESLLYARTWGIGEDIVIVTPDTVAALATWLLYGPGDDDDD